MGKVLRFVQSKGLEEYFRDFLWEKQVGGTSPRTLEDYAYHLGRFLECYKGKVEDYEKLRRCALEYLNGNGKLSACTFNIRRAYLKSFFAYLVAQGAISQNPLQGVKKRRVEEKPRAISTETLKNLLSLPDKRYFCGLRDYVLLLFSLDTGARPSESLKLRVEDFNLREGMVTIPAPVAKTRKPRVLPISPSVASWVQKLINARPREWDGPVFCSENGTELQPKSWSHILQKYSKKLGCRVTPYDLRHTFAILSLRGGMSPFALRAILGHTTLTMTQHYLHMSGEDLRREHDRSSPINQVIGKRLRKISV